ncbi:rap domain-containing protein [Cystoisospora suis]|uniref:Rap domain-containing protein n=1 Tax=Cystoisospora suis TaxID=483139 RepID=A0A2C6LB46_9APIC|nr:rap domain-containing protein [Cystoisospora suis]
MGRGLPPACCSRGEPLGCSLWRRMTPVPESSRLVQARTRNPELPRTDPGFRESRVPIRFCSLSRVQNSAPPPLEGGGLRPVLLRASHRERRTDSFSLNRVMNSLHLPRSQLCTGSRARLDRNEFLSVFWRLSHQLRHSSRSCSSVALLNSPVHGNEHFLWDIHKRGLEATGDRVRMMASLSKAEQHRKRMKRIQNKRMAWRPPNVSQRYLRAEADFNVLSIQRPRTGRLQGGPETAKKEIVDLGDPGIFVASRHHNEGGAGFDACSSRPEGRSDRRLLKPHEVAKLVQSREKVEGTRDDKTTAAVSHKSEEVAPSRSLTVALRRGHLPACTDISPLTAGDVEFDKTKGLYKENDAEYYRRFFRDRYRRLDGKEREAEKLLKEQTAEDARAQSRKQLYVPPRKYWYREDYCSPSPSEVRRMPSLELKFVMMNEARQVKKGKLPLNLPLWRAFEGRLVQLGGPNTRVRATTLLRGLQAISNIQHCALPATVDGIVRGIMYREASLKPQHYVFLYQSLARLRYRHVYLLNGLKEMMLSWSVLRNNFLIKAANAVSKLDLADHILVKPLQMTLATRIPGFTASNCRRTKWITVLNLFSEPMTVAFLKVCEKHETVFRDYSRDLQLVELCLRLEKPEVYAQLPLTTQYFLECVRKAHTEGKAARDANVKVHSLGSAADRRRRDHVDNKHSESRTWTRASRLTGGNTGYYTISDSSNKDSSHMIACCYGQNIGSVEVPDSSSDSNALGTFSTDVDDSDDDSASDCDDFEDHHSGGERDTAESVSGDFMPGGSEYGPSLTSGIGLSPPRSSSSGSLSLADFLPTPDSCESPAVPDHASLPSLPSVSLRAVDKNPCGLPGPSSATPEAHHEELSHVLCRNANPEAAVAGALHSSTASRARFGLSAADQHQNERVRGRGEDTSSLEGCHVEAKQRHDCATTEGPPASRTPCLDGLIQARDFSSLLHADVSHTLRSVGIDHSNSVLAGPLRVDVFHPPSNTIIETCPAFQFYANSVQLTAVSKRRHQLLLAMGFNVVLIPYQRWRAARTPDDKRRLVLSLLPPGVRQSRAPQ